MEKLLVLGFSECEHSGDLERYASDVRACGGEILRSSIDEEEEGRMEVRVADFAAFIAKFKESDAYEFLSYSRRL